MYQRAVASQTCSYNYAALLAWSHDLSLSILLYFLQVKLIYILRICLNLKAGSMELSSILTGLAKRLSRPRFHIFEYGLRNLL